MWQLSLPIAVQRVASRLVDASPVLGIPDGPYLSHASQEAAGPF